MTIPYETTPTRVLALAFALLGVAAGALAQPADGPRALTETFTLRAGERAGTFVAVLDLPAGTRGELESARLVSGAGVVLGEVSAETRFAARRPRLHATLPVRRADAATADAALPFAVELRYRTASAPRLVPRNGVTEPTTSVLAGAATYRVDVDVDGVYRVDRALLGALGASADGVAPSQVRLYSKGGAELPELVGVPYPTDLAEVPMVEVGNGDAIWDEGEYLLFYGEGEDVWRYDARLGDFERRENPYAENTAYFLQVGGAAGSRVAAAGPPLDAPAYDDAYTARARWEEDLDNVLYYSKTRYGSGQGSGQPFFGHFFGTVREVTREGVLPLGEVVAGGQGRLRSRLIASALSGGTRYTVDVAGEEFTSSRITAGRRADANDPLAHYGSVDAPVSLSSGSPSVTVRYPGSLEQNPGWLDYVQVTHPARLAYAGAPLRFSSLDHAAAGRYGFRVAGAAGLTVWDISDPLSPKRVTGRDEGGDLAFAYEQAEDGAPREFVVFDPRGAHSAPAAVGAVGPVANLHAISRADFVIVYGEGLGAAAERLAAHRRDRDGLAVVTASTAEVLLEFGGGRPDPTAIRTFAKMIYERDPGFRYLLLLGDGSFDPREIDTQGGNLVPTYQTDRANHEVRAFPTDDYFALLDDGEGVDRGSSLYPAGGLDLAVGRIPASTAAEADAVVSKVIRYDTDLAMLGEWRLRAVFVADDEDTNLHVNDMDAIADIDHRLFPEYNQEKIYVDAYEQVPTPGGVRIPRAAEAINQNMFRGNLVTTYLGHGGPRGWGQERFLNAPDIEKWNAANALPVLVTATCTFTGYDDPERTVAGEQVLFKRDGGAVATMSTVRPVYTNGNRALAERTHRVILDDSLALRYPLGELFRRAKDATGSVENNRKYTFFGDPSMQLAVPKLEVAVTRFDSVDVAQARDSAVVGPLREVTLSGEVRTRAGALAGDFDGEVVLTIFDQDRTARTLGQDAGSRVKQFRRQGPTLFTGRASVTDGRWEARFRLPRDLSLSRGAGRLSLYAKSPDGRDGAGLFNAFVIDGRGAPAVADDTPPRVEVFLGDEEFVAGGVTGEDPVLFARLTDDYGINVSGSAIGHDLTADLDGAQDGNYVLNDFYQAATDDYTGGEVRYPLFDLPAGEYELSVRAWDLANNPGEGATSFVVSDDPGVALRRVLNYPNPFVDATCFQFEHSAAGQLVDVQVDIYTASGRLVQSLTHSGLAQGARFGRGDDCIGWDGTDRYGQRLARGVYLYRVSMRTQDGERAGESDFEKLVVLR